MNEIIENAIAAINARLDDEGFEGEIKIVIENEGSIIIDENGARAGDEDTECTMTADAPTLEGMLQGEINPTAAFMSGALTVEGDMSQAMKLGAVLS